eukprot:g3680.t1
MNTDNIIIGDAISMTSVDLETSKKKDENEDEKKKSRNRDKDSSSSPSSTSLPTPLSLNTPPLIKDTQSFKDETSDIMNYLVEHIRLVEEALTKSGDAKLNTRRRSLTHDSLQVQRKKVPRLDVERVHLNALRAELKNIRSFATNARRAVKEVDALNAIERRRTSGSAILWGLVVFLTLSARLFIGVSVPVEYDASTVDCWNINELSGVVISISLVWVASKIADRIFLPRMFPATHLVMSPARRVKAVGNCIKCFGRLAVFLFLTALWPRFTLGSGLNLGETECEEVSDAVVRKIFYGSKALFLSIMMWECSAAPRMSPDIWVHHLVLIYAVALTTDSNLHVGGNDFDHLSTNEGFGLILMYGTAFNCFKEAYVGAFQHAMMDDYARHFRYLRGAVCAHVLNQSVFYFLLPVTYIAVASERGNMEIGQVALFVLSLAFLNALELYILRITIIVTQKRQRQAKIPSFWSGFPGGLLGG